MRKLLLLLLTCVASLYVSAADVTPSEALRQARQFLQDKVAASGHRASGEQLQLVGRVHDLYVFNVEADKGFVIVSNDDCATPILGYSDTGSLDLQHIPDNMRAWLQGYADEIQWAKQHVSPLSDGQQAKAPLRRTSNIKSPIAPLVQTQWSQDAPYNNLCPEYATGKYCATGCVATAMAQCMYFTEMRVGSTTTSTTAQIPGYTTESYGFKVQAVPINTEINWKNMCLSYASGYTSQQATAIAQLMLYCGTSVKMDYGPSSSAKSQNVATALKNYFGYNETTTHIVRSLYSYAKWIDIMYHELSQGRPVYYAGLSSGGGHAFVCDGYQGEDFFHINWGWGGLSDNYFKLSALDPDAQGIGGSISTDGFHYGQEAVIGIQKSEETGTLPDINVSEKPNLSLKSISIDKANIMGGETATITMSIINNANVDYDGDICLYDNHYGFLPGKTFFIAKGETKECTLSFTPEDKTETYTIYALYMREQLGYNYISSSMTVTLNVTGSGIEYTNNVPLDVSVQPAEHTELYGSFTSGMPAYNLYGNRFNAVVNVTNSTDSNYQGQFQMELFDNSSNKTMAQVSSVITVPANSSIQIPIAASGLTIGNIYILGSVYIKDNDWSGWKNHAGYISRPAFISYAADGTATITEPATTFEVPATATAVDLTGTDVSTVTPNSNPNTLYILGAGQTLPSGLASSNVVRGNGGTYTAATVKLTDGNDFYTPVDFTATNIEFTYTNTRWADGTNGWNTIMLPFDVSSVTADGTAIDWFHSSSDKSKQFWLKTFSGDAANTVYFDFADQLKANTPYIIALPGEHWGDEYDLSKKTIKFLGENTVVTMNAGDDVVTGGNYRFIGSTTAVTATNIYCLNDVGNSFTLNDAGCQPFRAYFKPGAFDRTVTMLTIGSGGGTTGINEVSSSKIQVSCSDYFDLQGRKVSNGKWSNGQMPKGLYIVNGKKVIIK